MSNSAFKLGNLRAGGRFNFSVAVPPMKASISADNFERSFLFLVSNARRAFKVLALTKSYSLMHPLFYLSNSSNAA